MLRRVLDLMSIREEHTLHVFFAGVSKGDFASKSHMVFNIMVIKTRGKSYKGKQKQNDCVGDCPGVIKGFRKALPCD